MRKIAFVSLIVVLFGSFVFADDALVIPQGVFRLRIAPSYSMTSQAYDKDGKAADSAMKNTLVAGSGAFELGIIDPVTFGLKWAPGYYIASTFTDDLYKDATYTGPADLEVGAKVQVIGSNGFVKNEALRFALTGGVGIPIDNYDAKAESEKLLKGEKYRGMSTSGHQSLGFGVKADADYAFGEMFFVNAHGQAFYYMPSKKIALETYVYNAMTAAATSKAIADAMVPLTETETVYGMEYAFELEPHVKLSIDKNTSVSAGLPVTYAMNLAGSSTYNSVKTDIEAASLLTIGPKVSAFLMLGPLPFEAEIQYELPLMGTNNLATSTLSLQLKFFGKIF